MDASTECSRASLFGPFRRLHADRVGSARGSGLGLFVVRVVARARGGGATASPVAGGSLRVTVVLPATLAQLPVAANQPKAGLSTNMMGAMHG